MRNAKGIPNFDPEMPGGASGGKPGAGTRLGTQLDYAKRVFPSSRRRLNPANSRRIHGARKAGRAEAGAAEWTNRDGTWPDKRGKAARIRAEATKRGREREREREGEIEDAVELKEEIKSDRSERLPRGARASLFVSGPPPRFFSLFSAAPACSNNDSASTSCSQPAGSSESLLSSIDSQTT